MRLNLISLYLFLIEIFFRLLACDKVAFLYLYKIFSWYFLLFHLVVVVICCWWYIVQEHVIVYLYYIMKREHRFYHTFLILEWHNVHTNLFEEKNKRESEREIVRK